MSCPLCDEAKNLALHETDTYQVLLHPRPAVPGHLLIIPKEHYPIMEQVPDEVVGEMFNAASKMSALLFEGMKAQGTNVLVQNGLPAGQTEPHVSIHVVPRQPEDGMNFMWQPKQMSDEDLNRIENALKDGTGDVGVVTAPAPPKEVEHEVQEMEEEDEELKHLDRIP